MCASGALAVSKVSNSGGWNAAACAAKGLGVPPFLQPGFKERSKEWAEEADAEAEAAVRAMLDGAAAEPPRASTAA